MTARDDLYAYATVAFREDGVPEIVHNYVTRMLDALVAEARVEALEEAASAVDDEAWPHERPERENEEFYRIANLIRERTKLCHYCRGDGDIEDQDGEWDYEVNRWPRFQCPACAGSGRAPAPQCPEALFDPDAGDLWRCVEHNPHDDHRAEDGTVWADPMKGGRPNVDMPF